MIEIATENFAGIECLHATPAGKRHTALPTILFWHGFTSSKEVYAWFAVALAQAGFRVVMPDADMHGSRYNGDSELRLTSFWEILRSNIDEVPLLEAALNEQRLITEGRFAVAGASMGGMTALGAMARYSHLSCVACLMGSGYFMSLARTLFPPLAAATPEQKKTLDGRLAPLAEYDVSQQLEKLGDRPLLVWHGDADEVVPAAESARLEKALREAKLDANLTYITERGIGHRITPPALTATAAFFTHHL
ncbi:esterase [Erwinia typographi]|uniref:Esterase n=1 Tax=Erwinia typographi TaxID=371042 RepID=A0A0A4A964_9GAMM|nr:esterase [Erwinia typographi]KGT94368.1 esterase [Erwinia typographi]